MSSAVRRGTSGDGASRHRIVVGVDGSNSSIEALRWARRIAAAVGAEIDAVICWEFSLNLTFDVVPVDYRPDQDAEHILSAALTAATVRGIPRVHEHWFATGTQPKCSPRPDVTLRCWWSATAAMAASSVCYSARSAYCAEHADCPVVVVHQPPVEAQK
jgi:nucleotide-binding universal stress UspA family protein